MPTTQEYNNWKVQFTAAWCMCGNEYTGWSFEVYDRYEIFILLNILQI